MQKLVRLILVGTLVFTTLQAKELFNLKAQDFEYTLGNMQINAKYKVNDNITVETNLLKTKQGFYVTKTYNTGYFNIVLEKPINNFLFHSDIIYNSTVRSFTNRNKTKEGYTYNEKRFIRFMDQDGKNIILEFNKDGFTLNGKDFKASTDLETIDLQISKQDNKLVIKINNSNLIDENTDFSNLKYIDISLINFYRDAYMYAYDKLNNIILIENE